MKNRKATPPLIIVIVCCLGVMPSCRMFQPTRTVSAEGDMPKRFSDYGQGADSADRWWESFGSVELNALVEEALTQNLTLEQAWAQLQQAESLAVQSRSSLYPQVNFELGASSNRRMQQVPYESPGKLSESLTQGGSLTSKVLGLTAAPAGAATSAGQIGSSLGQLTSKQGKLHDVAVTTNDYSLGLAASYEVDLWGRIRSGARAADLDVQAARLDLEAGATTLAAQVTEYYLRIVEQQARKAVLDEQLTTNTTYLELVELRFRKSMVSALDVYQQRQKVAQVEALMPLTISEEKVLKHGLSVLLGRLPTAEVTGDKYNQIDLPPLPETGLPTDLLASRPDVKSAWASLSSADWRVAEAKADRLPAIKLNAGVGYRAGEWNLLFDQWYTTLAANLLQPIFDGHRRKAEVKRTEAIVRQRLANYRQTVLTAIQEVQDALIEEHKQRDYIEALKRQEDFARKALIQARDRYLKGLIDYLPVLSQLETVQRLELDLIAAHRQLLIYRVNLYRALGGDWTGDLEDKSVITHALSVKENGDAKND